MTKVILWDLMDTLVSDPFFTHVPGFFGMQFEEMLAAKHPTAWREFEVGAIDEATLFARFFIDGRPIDGPGLKRCMGENTQWLEGMESLLAELARTGREMHLLSNYAPWYRMSFERLGIGRYVEPTFVSCHTGVRKPDPESYLGPCQKLGVSPAECLFVDDRELNCAGARQAGLDAVRFTGNAGALRAELVRRGLLDG